MGHDVQSQAGISLAPAYDVKGSQAPIERLITAEVPVVHDMASTLFSERLSGGVRRRTTGDLAQSTSFDEIIDDFGKGITRIVGLAVLADVLARSSFVNVSVRDPVNGREVPIFVWDSTFDIFKIIRIQEDDGAVGNMQMLIPAQANPPALSMLIGTEQPQSMPDIAFRGVTTAFGAGTVEHILILYTASTAVANNQGYGLPIPGW